MPANSYQDSGLATKLHARSEEIRTAGLLVARDQNGAVIMPAPIDYLSWTPRIAAFGTAPALLALHHRVLWIPTKMTPLARKQLEANGWSVHESAQP